MKRAEGTLRRVIQVSRVNPSTQASALKDPYIFYACKIFYLMPLETIAHLTMYPSVAYNVGLQPPYVHVNRGYMLYSSIRP